MTLTRQATLWLVIALAAPHGAFPANVFLTNAQFVNHGAGAFIGLITDVQVMSSDQYSESGTVQLQVTRVIEGTVNTQSVTFAYQRALAAIDDASNWDLLAPTDTSLAKVGIGRSVLIHFTQSNGTYSLAPGGNAVQDASQGVLLGRIKTAEEGRPDGKRRARNIEVEVLEVVYGYVDGSQVTFPYTRESLEQVSHLPGVGFRNAVPLERESQHDLKDREFFIEFDARGISGVEVATRDLLKQLQQADIE